MNKITKLSLILSSIALGVGIFSAVSASFSKEVNGYTTASLPTTIDLNDTAESDIRKYYSSLNSLSEAELKGSNLLKNLKPILKNGQKYYAYDNGGSAIWKIYEIADRDWAKSPASGTTYGTYNATTNKITGYQYGSSKSNSKNNPYIHALYVNRNVENLTTAWDDHGQTQWGINREHVWPKSQGFEAEGAGGARGDPFHLMAGNGRVNGTEHNNNLYGYVDTKQGTQDPATEKGWTNLSNNMSGVSLTLGAGKVFEPQDSDKGDIARAIFYMVARYNYLSGSDSDGISTDNPNLELAQTAAALASYTSTTSNAGKMGVLTDLLAWHHADPVDSFEIHRNNLLYTNYTNNRNPFIDFPEWVDYIWGTVNYSGRKYNSYDSTPTGYAQPSTDTLNGYNSGSSDHLDLDITKANLVVGGDTVELTATPSSAATVAWTTSNSSVVTISNLSGTKTTLTGVAAGNATVTASATINAVEYTKVCNVSVTAADAEDVSADVLITRANYIAGWGSSGTSGTIYKSVANEDDLTINYAGINTESEGGSAYGYTMYYGGNGYIYSNNCPSGYYPSKVIVTYTTKTGTSAKVGITFGSSVLSSKIATVNESPVKGGTTVLENDDMDNRYWNYSTKSANVQVLSIEVQYEIAIREVTSVTLNRLESTLKIGSTLQLEATVLPDDADDKTIVYESSDESVATVSDTGLVQGILGGTATIYAYASNGVYDACVVTVLYTTTGFYKVTSNASIEDGTYLIVYEEGEKAFNGDLASLDASYNTVDVDIDNGFIAYDSDLVDSTFTIATKADGYSIRSNSGKYIGRADNVYGDSNGLSANNSDIYLNTIEIDVNNDLLICSRNTYMRFNTASGQERFRYFKEATYFIQKSIAIYKYIYCSDQFSIDFVNAISCDNTGVNAPTLGKTWNELKALYNNVSDKVTLKDATYTVDYLTVTPTGSTTQVVANAVSLYDYLVEKYNYEAFIENRSNNTKVVNIDTSIASANSNAVTVVIVFIGTLLASSVVLTIRRFKKEQ